MRTLHVRTAMFNVVGMALIAAAGLVSRASLLVAQQNPARITVDSLAKALAGLHESSDSASIPAASSFAFGDSTVAAGRHTSGPVAIADGTLHVRGTVDGDAVTYNGDIVVHQGGAIRGNAFAVLGKVVLDGGTISGDTRALSGDLRRTGSGGAAPGRSRTSIMAHSLALSAGWLAMLVVVGIGVLIFASTNLDAVSDALERGFGKSFLAGVATQLALAPALALLCVGLALTIIGALLIPFAVVAYILAAAGLVTLGYLAIARMAGGTVLGDSGNSDGARRAAALRSMVYGLLLLMLPWFIAGGLSWSPGLELIARMVAVSITWVAATAGLGAAVVSRGGVRRTTTPRAQASLNTASWATPTPVAGVTAARRPTPYTTGPPK
jgi:hypothetical protein